MSAPAEHRYDAVVIGAGNGGMAAACQIAVGGKSVLLLEQHNIVGGFSTSFVRGRFEFEASLHELCELGTAADKGILYRMFEDLGIDVDWIRVPEAYRLLVPGGENDRIDAILPFGIDEYVEAVEGYCPGSRESVRRFFELAGEMCDAMVYVQDLQTDIGTLSKPYMLRHYPNFLKAGAYTVEEVFEALAMPKRAREILSAYWCYLGVPLDRMDFAFYGYMVYEYIKRGAYIPRYRSTEFAQAFEKRIRQCGGDVWCGVKAEKVLVENGRVTGVITDQGQRILTKQVVCNASPYHLYSEMISPAEAVPKQALREIGGRTPSVSGFVIFIGLDRTAAKRRVGRPDVED